MADILYSWSDLENNIMDGKIGYFHGKMAPLNKSKQRNPDFIWIVRLKDDMLWLLGKLKVTDKKPANFPKDHDPEFIFYDPIESKFFKDVHRVKALTEERLNKACKKMRHGTMQGVSSVDELDPFIQNELDRIVSPLETISFAEFRRELEVGNLPRPPFKKIKSRVASKERNLAETIREIEGVTETNVLSEDKTSLQQQGTEGEGLNSVISTSAQMKLDTDTPNLTTSERDAVVKVRYGQGEFREALFKEDGERCWMSGIEGRRLLVASHIKPWSHCKDDLDSRGQPDNGLLLSSLWDAAFDVGLISFDEDWQVITSTELSLSAKQALSLDQYTALPDKFRKNGRRKFLAYHRAEVFEFWKKVVSPKKDQA